MNGHETENLLALERQACFALSLASRTVIAAYRPVLKPLNLTHPQYLVMLALWQYAPLSNKELASLLHAEPSTLSPLLKRLENLGYITRSRSPTDERSISIDLTTTGQNLRTQAEKIPQTMMQRLGLDETELTKLHSSMMKLIQTAEEAPWEPAPE